MLDLNMLKEVGKTLHVNCTGHVYDYNEYLDAYEFEITKDGEVIEYIYVDTNIFEPVKVKGVRDISQDNFSVLKKSAINLVETCNDEMLWENFDEYKSDDCDEVFNNVDVYNAYINIIDTCLDLMQSR